MRAVGQHACSDTALYCPVDVLKIGNFVTDIHAHTRYPGVRYVPWTPRVECLPRGRCLGLTAPHRTATSRPTRPDRATQVGVAASCHWPECECSGHDIVPRGRSVFQMVLTGLARRYDVNVSSGSVLYIPRGWWHVVDSKILNNGSHVAVNFWFK